MSYSCPKCNSLFSTDVEDVVGTRCDFGCLICQIFLLKKNNQSRLDPINNIHCYELFDDSVDYTTLPIIEGTIEHCLRVFKLKAFF